MKHRRVVTTPEADADAQRIDEWWIQHRGAAPNLFVEELADEVRRSLASPRVRSNDQTRLVRHPAQGGF